MNELLITIRFVFLKGDEIVAEFDCCGMTFESVKEAEDMIMDQLESLDYIFVGCPAEQVSACIIEESVPMDMSVYTDFDRDEADNQTYMVVCRRDRCERTEEVLARDPAFGEILIFMSVDEAEEYILGLNEIVPMSAEPTTFCIIKTDLDRIPVGESAMVWATLHMNAIR